VLALDRDHPRALLGLARVALEGGDPEAAKPYLRRALQYHGDFPEARALEEMIERWPTGPASMPTEAAPPAVRLSQGGHDAILVHGDGRVVFAQGDDARRAMLVRHVLQIARMASATLSRAGLGALRHGVVEAAAETTYLRTDAGLVLSIAQPGDTPIEDGLRELGHLWAEQCEAEGRGHAG
jgi:hypothetical protein